MNHIKITVSTRAITGCVQNTANITQDHAFTGKAELHKFKVCKSVHQHTFQINQPTRCKNFSSLLLDVYVQLNMFRASSCPSSGAQQLQ